MSVHALLTFPQLISALVSSSHLMSALLSALSNHLGAKANDPYVFHWKDLTQKSLHTASFCTEKLANPNLGKFLLTKKFHTRQVFTQKLYIENCFHAASFHTEKIFTHWSFYTQKFLRRAVFAQRILYTAMFLHTTNFYTQFFLHRETFTQRNFYTFVQNHLCEFWCGMHRTCKNTSAKPDRSSWMTRSEKLCEGNLSTSLLDESNHSDAARSSPIDH